MRNQSKARCISSRFLNNKQEFMTEIFDYFKIPLKPFYKLFHTCM